MQDAAQNPLERRFASLYALAQTARRTFARFPFVLLSAIAAAIAAHLLMTEHLVVNEGKENTFWPIIMSASLGIPLFFAIRMLIESRRWPRWLELGAPLAGLGALVIYYAILPTTLKGGDLFRYVSLSFGLHLSVAFAPFVVVAGTENAFWQYNKTLFMRFAQAVLYSGVLYVGLALAIAALEALLDFDFGEDVYLQLGLWVAFVYNTWFFLAGIPSDVKGLAQVRDYPPALKIFTQYVLVPLVAVYLIILYAYLVRIVINWDLPKGWVGVPVAGASVAGMLALLLIHPVKKQAENAWVRTYGRFFYWALFPLIGLLAVAIGTRIADYGITEMRYAVVVLTAWLLGIAIYFSFARLKNIKVIPISLCILAFAGSFGPWGGTSISRRSQVGRLRELLVVSEVMVDGKLDERRKTVELEQQQEISNIVTYLYQFHGLERLREWYAQSEQLPAELDYTMAVRQMGLEYVSRWDRPDAFSLVPDEPRLIPVEGFTHMYRFSVWTGDPPSIQSESIGEGLELTLEGNAFHMSKTDDSTSRLTVQLEAPLMAMREEEAQRGEAISVEQATLDAENDHFKMRVHLEHASGRLEEDRLTLTTFSATVLFSIK